jgi:type II restriction/modification system DNA methylase subunit YeeA
MGGCMWKAIELQADYWIIQDDNGYDEYMDAHGDNLMFTTKDEAEEKIYMINIGRVQKMDITNAIEIIKEYGNNIGTTDILLTLNEMLDDEDISNRDRCARNLFMHEGRKMFESVKIKLEV